MRDRPRQSLCKKSAVTTTAATASLAIILGAAGLFGSAIANAGTSNNPNGDATASTTPPTMKLAASADEHIRTTGTQGTVATADQCTELSSTKVACVTPSVESTPQYTK